MAQTAPKKAPHRVRVQPDTVRELVDTRGNVRIYTDVPPKVAEDFAILAIRRKKSKRALMAELIMGAVVGK